LRPSARRTERRLVREAATALMSPACYREKHGPSGALDNITISAGVCGCQRPLIFTSSVCISRAVLFRSLAWRACWFVCMSPGQGDRSPGVGRSPGPHGPPDPRLSQRTTVRSGRRVPHARPEYVAHTMCRSVARPEYGRTRRRDACAYFLACFTRGVSAAKSAIGSLVSEPGSY
jgi:hypothetical protein